MLWGRVMIHVAEPAFHTDFENKMIELRSGPAAYIVHCVFKVPYKAARVGRLSGRVFHEGRNCRRQEVWNAGCVKRVPLGEGEGLVPWSLVFEIL